MPRLGGADNTTGIPLHAPFPRNHGPGVRHQQCPQAGVANLGLIAALPLMVFGCSRNGCPLLLVPAIVATTPYKQQRRLPPGDQPAQFE